MARNELSDSCLPAGRQVSRPQRSYTTSDVRQGIVTMVVKNGAELLEEEGKGLTIHHIRTKS